ncbi:hypothetical protein F4809DRAFT_117514 [Biscogniauxia mediterranea]|nr:hypothetical protein F4809DRAFT_117514 [Biscogniauxia mediterranea]
MHLPKLNPSHPSHALEPFFCLLPSLLTLGTYLKIPTHSTYATLLLLTSFLLPLNLKPRLAIRLELAVAPLVASTLFAFFSLAHCFPSSQHRGAAYRKKHNPIT